MHNPITPLHCLHGVDEQVGIAMRVIRLLPTIDQNELEETVKMACRDPQTDGVLVQLPLPRHLDEEAIMSFFDPQKDVDGLHVLNMG